MPSKRGDKGNFLKPEQMNNTYGGGGKNFLSKNKPNTFLNKNP